MGIIEVLHTHRFAWETVVALATVVSSAFIYYRARMLYRLSKYPGLRYFSNAFLNFGIAVGVGYSIIVLDQFIYHGGLHPGMFPGLLLYFIFLYSGSLAGFYLSYSLVWKHLELEHRMRGNTVCFLLGLGAAVLALTEILIALKNPTGQIYLIFTVQIIVLLFSLIDSYSHTKHFRLFDPYHLSILLALSVFLVLFLGELLSSVWPVISLLSRGAVALIFVIVVGHVFRLTQ